MNKINGQSPSLTDLFYESKRDIYNSLNCVKVGKVFSFDQAKKTAQIQILFKTKANSVYKSVPLLVDVPVFTLQGGAGSVQMPIAAGDDCLVLFSDRDIDSWFLTGSESAPTTPRCHDLSDAIALVGLNSRVSTLPSYDTNVNINIPSTKKLVVKSTGAATAEIFGTSALALLSELQTLINWAKTHTHSSGGSGVPNVLPGDATGTTKLKGA